MADRRRGGDGGEDGRELALLLALLTSPFDPARVTARLAGGVDWAAFRLLVRRHRVLSLISSRLEIYRRATSGLDEEGSAVAARLAEGARQSARSGLAQIAEAGRVAGLFDAAGIDHLQLKGAPLSTRAFGRPLLRDGRDVDVLIAPDALATADAVLRGAGYRRIEPSIDMGRLRRRLHLVHAHEYVFVAPSGVTVELKARLQPIARLLPLAPAALLARAVTLDVAGQPTRALADADLLLYLCVHGSRHCWFRLKWLADIAALSAGDGGRLVTAALATADELGIAVPVLEAAHLAHHRLGAEVPEAVLRRAEADPMVRARRAAVDNSIRLVGPGGDPHGDRALSRWRLFAEYRLRAEWSYRGAVLARHVLIALSEPGAIGKAYSALRTALRPRGTISAASDPE